MTEVTGIVSAPHLDSQSIELANAHGPYSHGVWASAQTMMGNEEALAGRGMLLVNQIRRALLARYTEDQMRTMTLVDIGCYDGWLTCQLAGLPFQSVIGIEPRQKNIEKGRFIRKLLGIETRCEFRQGSLDTLAQALDGKKADIVICVGVLHHLSSITDGIAKLHSICNQFIFLEALCLPSAIESEPLRKALELKDLPYFFGDQGFGVTGHKLESGYYDGSAQSMSVVSIPSVNALQLFLRTQGFENVAVVTDPSAYIDTVKGGWRDLSAVCLTADVSSDSTADRIVADWVEKYEGGLITTLLDPALADRLYYHYRATSASQRMSWSARVAFGTITATGAARRLWRAMLRPDGDRYLSEIYKNLAYAPHDKTALEHGKCLIAQRRYSDAIEVLLGITQRQNADWRSVYRAFCLLHWLYRHSGDATMSDRYASLCLTANPQFPASLIAGSVDLLKISK